MNLSFKRFFFIFINILIFSKIIFGQSVQKESETSSSAYFFLISGIFRSKIVGKGFGIGYDTKNFGAYDIDYVGSDLSDSSFLSSSAFLSQETLLSINRISINSWHAIGWGTFVNLGFSQIADEVQMKIATFADQQQMTMICKKNDYTINIGLSHQLMIKDRIAIKFSWFQYHIPFMRKNETSSSSIGDESSNQSKSLLEGQKKAQNWLTKNPLDLALISANIYF